jgi:hypothetical protein
VVGASLPLCLNELALAIPGYLLIKLLVEVIVCLIGAPMNRRGAYLVSSLALTVFLLAAAPAWTATDRNVVVPMVNATRAVFVVKVDLPAGARVDYGILPGVCSF